MHSGRFQTFNPYWQISETKSKNWVRHRASFSETKSKKISKNLFWVCHRASFLETKSRQKSQVISLSFLGDFLEYVQLEKAVGKDEKLESPKLESFTEVGKSQAKLE